MEIFSHDISTHLLRLTVNDLDAFMLSKVSDKEILQFNMLLRFALKAQLIAPVSSS